MSENSKNSGNFRTIRLYRLSNDRKRHGLFRALSAQETRGTFGGTVTVADRWNGFYRSINHKLKGNLFIERAFWESNEKKKSHAISIHHEVTKKHEGNTKKKITFY